MHRKNSDYTVLAAGDAHGSDYSIAGGEELPWQGRGHPEVSMVQAWMLRSNDDSRSGRWRAGAGGEERRWRCWRRLASKHTLARDREGVFKRCIDEGMFMGSCLDHKTGCEFELGRNILASSHLSRAGPKWANFGEIRSIWAESQNRDLNTVEKYTYHLHPYRVTYMKIKNY